MEEKIKELIREVLLEEIPKIVRQANRKDWLTTKEFEELFGVSSRLQKHYRDELNMPFYQEKKKILYSTDEVEGWFRQRKGKDVKYDGHSRYSN